MARKRARPRATLQYTLEPLQTTCPACGSRLWMACHRQRTVTTLPGGTRLILKVDRCRNAKWARFHQVYRPEEEGGGALPHGEFGLDVIALGGLCALKSNAVSPRFIRS